MTPDAYTLTFLLVLADEFNSDDGLHCIMWMDEESADYWEAPYAGACWPCKRVRDEAVCQGRPVPGLTVPETHAISFWRPVHDGADAVASLQEHEGCGEVPLALRRALGDDTDHEDGDHLPISGDGEE